LRVLQNQSTKRNLKLISPRRNLTWAIGKRELIP